MEPPHETVAQAENSGAPLRGLRVLDLSLNLPGPYATFILASLGAEVVKLEPPRGDPARNARPFFDMINRGKRSVVLDLREPESREPMRALVRRSDVLLEGFRPGVMEGLGWGYAAARDENPRLVYCSISAYGQDGPRAREPGHDLNLQALSGVSHLERSAGGAPRRTLLPIADLSTSLAAVAAICAALVARERDGVGQHLDVAMADAVLSWSTLWGVGLDMAGQARRQFARAPGGRALVAVARPFLSMLERQRLYAIPHYGVFVARDGRYLALGIVDEQHFWRRLCEELGLGRWSRLPLPARIASGPLLRRLIARRLGARGRDEWLSRLIEAGVPVTPVLGPEEARGEAQFVARDLFDRHGYVRAPVPGSVHVSGTAPDLGEHTAEVLEAIAEVDPRDRLG